MISQPSYKFMAWLVLAVTVLVWGGNFISSYLGGPSLTLGRPFWSMLNASGNIWGGVGAIFADKNRLLNENQTLRSQLNLAGAKLRQSDLLFSENTFLRTELGRRANDELPSALARILVSWPETMLDLLVVDLGRDNANHVPKIGEKVLTGGNIWLGEVVTVGDRSSKVKLLSLAGTMIPAVLGSSRVPISLLGRGGGNFVTTLPRSVLVKSGDLAFASGQNGDWLVAVVGAIEFDPAGTEQKIFLRQPVQAISLKYVELAPN